MHPRILENAASGNGHNCEERGTLAERPDLPRLCNVKPLLLGIDVGLEHFLSASDGEQNTHPRFLEDPSFALSASPTGRRVRGLFFWRSITLAVPASAFFVGLMPAGVCVPLLRGGDPAIFL